MFVEVGAGSPWQRDIFEGNSAKQEVFSGGTLRRGDLSPSSHSDGGWVMTDRWSESSGRSAGSGGWAGRRKHCITAQRLLHGSDCTESFCVVTNTHTRTQTHISFAIAQ